MLRFPDGNYLELALYAAAEHVDDIKLIAKGFFPNTKKYISSKPASTLARAIKKEKTLISASINAIKHHQARIRLYSLEIIYTSTEHCLHGFFIEGVNNGTVGPNKIFHDKESQVFSITSIGWEILCFVLNSSRYLKIFLQEILEDPPLGQTKVEDKTFSKAIVAAARLPLYSFDDKHPFSKTRIILSGNPKSIETLESNIYGSISNKWEKSGDMKFLRDVGNYEGDGITKSFQMVKPMTISLQHWD